MSVDISRFDIEGETFWVVGYPLKRPHSFAGLTAAELEVTEGVIAGLSTRALARQRGASERTVANQLARVYRKLGVASKFELLALVGGSRPNSKA